MSEQNPENEPQTKTPQGQKPSLRARLEALGLSAMAQRYAGIGVVAVFALVIVLVMSNFASDVQGSQQDSLRATAQALAQPMIDAQTGGEAGALMQEFTAAGGSFISGIPRHASLDTTIPTRSRVTLDTYTVQQGDNLFGIAETYGLRPESILWANFVVLEDNPNVLAPGQVLNIMPTDGTLHTYQAGESLEAIADFYGVLPDAIIEWPGNNLDPYDTDVNNPGIEAGTALIIPGGERELRDWGPPAITRDNPAVAAYYGAGACGSIYTGEIGDGVFVWPTVATYLSGFNYNPPLHPAIDIAGAEGNAIFAADSGVVVYAGWSDSGYGNLLVIDHGNGWQTAYAHLVSISVGCGTSVTRGEVVAGLGTTGNSSGPHLHFEMYSSIYGKVNPYLYVSP